MKYREPSAIQTIAYIIGNLPKGTILADWEFENNLTQLYNSKQIHEALSLMSTGNNGIPKLLENEGSIYTIIAEPKEIKYYIPLDMEDTLEKILDKFKSKKEI